MFDVVLLARTVFSIIQFVTLKYLRLKPNNFFQPSSCSVAGTYTIQVVLSNDLLLTSYTLYFILAAVYVQ